MRPLRQVRSWQFFGKGVHQLRLDRRRRRQRREETP
jgi:hypothetical protein